MKLRVQAAFPLGDDCWVEFSSALGRGEALWRSHAPEPGRDYFVELELSPPVELTPAVARVPLLEASREGVLARGEIVHLVDGLSTLRVGDAELHLEQPLEGWWAVRSGPLLMFDVVDHR